MHTEPHVVIVGGGFSGAAVAIHLLRLAPVDVRVTLLEPRETPGAGVAYSTTEPSHRINVPAVRMQLAGEEEGAFDSWYRNQPAFVDDPLAQLADGVVYPQRGQFGLYVAQRFAEAAHASAGRLIHLREQALSLSDGDVITDGGRRLSADLLVLAISHPPPSLPSLARSFEKTSGINCQPLASGRSGRYRAGGQRGGNGDRSDDGGYRRDPDAPGSSRANYRIFTPWAVITQQPERQQRELAR